MRALRWDGTALRVVDCDSPLPSPSRAIVRVTAAGICNTDLELTRGYMGFNGILGHEFVGVVEHGPSEWQRRRVVGEINFACGHCGYCARGLGRHCPHRSVMGILAADGAIAEQLSIPLENLHAVPASVSDDEAVFAEPLAAAYEVLEQTQVESGWHCTVLGDGKLGLLVAQVLATTGANVRCVGKHPDKLALLAARGIETVLSQNWDHAPADLVVEATGSAAGLRAAIAATRPRGTVVLKSTVAERSDVDLSPLVINEISVVGSRCGPFAPALAALEAKQVDVAGLITARVPLAEAEKALTLAAQPGVLKVLVDCR